MHAGFLLGWGLSLLTMRGGVCLPFSIHCSPLSFFCPFNCSSTTQTCSCDHLSHSPLPPWLSAMGLSWPSQPLKGLVISGSMMMIIIIVIAIITIIVCWVHKEEEWMTFVTLVYQRLMIWCNNSHIPHCNCFSCSSPHCSSRGYEKTSRPLSGWCAYTEACWLFVSQWWWLGSQLTRMTVMRKELLWRQEHRVDTHSRCHFWSLQVSEMSSSRGFMRPAVGIGTVGSFKKGKRTSQDRWGIWQILSKVCKCCSVSQITPLCQVGAMGDCKTSFHGSGCPNTWVVRKLWKAVAVQNSLQDRWFGKSRWPRQAVLQSWVEDDLLSLDPILQAATDETTNQFKVARESWADREGFMWRWPGKNASWSQTGTEALFAPKVPTTMLHFLKQIACWSDQTWGCMHDDS